MPGAGRTAGARVSRCTVSEPAPFDPPIQRLDLARGPLAYTDEGGPAAPRTVVCIHGLPGSHRDFRYLAPELTALGARVVRFDMPGFGDTPTATAAGLTVPDRAQVVREALEALELLDTVLVGHSMGGPVSLHAACEVPERVTALAMLSSPGLTPHRAFVRANVRRSARLLRIGVLRWLLKGALRRGYTRAGFPRSLTHEARVQAVLQAAEVDFEQNQANADRLRAPTLVAWAKDDKLMEREISVALRAALPGHAELEFETGGHNIQKTHARELAAAILALA